MSNHGSLEQHTPDDDYFTGLIGYTSGGVPFPLDPREKVHRSILSEMDSTGHRPVRLFFERDLPQFQKIVAQYNEENADRNTVANLPRWTVDDIVTGAHDGDVPLPPSNTARVASQADAPTPSVKPDAAPPAPTKAERNK